MADIIQTIQDANMIPLMLKGLKLTMEVFFVTLLALPLGLPVALGENSRILPIRWFCNAYVLVFRGTPLLLQLVFFYFAVHIPIDTSLYNQRFIAIALAFILNYTAYLAEIYRGGINSIDRGQYEAAYSLGLSKRQTMFGIVIPQMMRATLPPVGNEIIILVKDTSLIYAIGMYDILHYARAINNTTTSMVPYLLAAVIYLIITMALTWVLKRIEQHYTRYDEKSEV